MNLEKISPVHVKTPLFSFTGERVLTEGSIELPTTFGIEGGTQVTRMVNYMIVDQPSAYNVIIGRPALNQLRAVTSTFHLLVKFPTPDGVGIMQGSQADSRACYV